MFSQGISYLYAHWAFGFMPGFLAKKSVEDDKKLFSVEVDPNLSEMSYDRLLSRVKERAERPVSQVMVPITETVDFEDHVMKVIYEMVNNDLSLLPVIRNEKVVGVVRSVDVFHQIANHIL